MVAITPSFLRRPLAAVITATLLVVGSAAHAVEVETAAREAILVDFATGKVLFEKNADELMPPSSMSKLMTSYMVFDHIKDGSLSLEDTFPVSERAWRKQGSKMFVHVGDQVSVEDLLRGVIVQSGNDACIVLAEGLAGSEEAFAERMNRRAREIGLTSSTFRNATGWPDEGHLMTARDLATLARRLIMDHPEYYHLYSERNFTYAGITQGNRNPLLYRNMGADGLKTGHTEAAGYGLTASVQRDGRRLILVVNGLKSMQQRADESARLLEWGFREFDNYTLAEAGEAFTEAEVWLGQKATVPLIAADKAVVTLPRRARENMEVKAVYEGPVAAPIRKGDQIAKLVVSVPDQAPIELPLYAGADVERLGFVGRIGAALQHVVFGPN
ncbi:D-alanyl-D-alanine carboxypeptidase family protein [Telmatospirillum sp. J64-1]|uniref:D-alanyl-D-alanine carboxypeptidase family protein n=1 Tax=Telmatospirillum sp. J64-1 TaxID=2502183 RepID=UPI00115F421D|nr:D-alanyl-D-alanine carboxypeptidase family protein [Telmatospirillum sp. J64-1]